jgi:membrane-anchored glycerophosphoryl diester phosphodiesterase (GDPDase)
MKKISYSLSILILSALAPLSQAKAGLSDAFNSPLDIVAGKANYNMNANFVSILGSIISLLLSLLGVIFVILIVYGGFEWMTAGGIETKIEKAKEIIRQSFIGLIIVIGAYAISYFLINAFAGK